MPNQQVGGAVEGVGGVFRAELKSKKTKKMEASRLFIAEEIGIVSCAIK